MADVAHHLGVTLVTPGEPGADHPVLIRDGHWTVLPEPARIDLGTRLAPLIHRALRSGGRSETLIGDQSEPADPVVRRRLGLPPLR
jgi:hypothetical protein